MSGYKILTVFRGTDDGNGFLSNVTSLVEWVIEVTPLDDEGNRKTMVQTDSKVIKLYTPLPCSCTVVADGYRQVCGREAFQAVAMPNYAEPDVVVLSGWWVYPICASCAAERVSKAMAVKDGEQKDQAEG